MRLYYARGESKYFYIFNDGRKYQKGIRPWNSKKYNLKIYISNQLEEFIKTKTNIEIIESKED